MKRLKAEEEAEAEEEQTALEEEETGCEPEDEPQNPLDAPTDSWLLSGDLVIRIHRQARETLFDPRDVETPIPLKYLDVMRKTETDLIEKSEATIEDLWTDKPRKVLSSAWEREDHIYHQENGSTTWVQMGQWSSHQRAENHTPRQRLA